MRGPIEPELLAHRLDVLRRRVGAEDHRGDVARQDLDDDEDDDRNDQQDEQRKQQPADDEDAEGHVQCTSSIADASRDPAMYVPACAGTTIQPEHKPYASQTRLTSTHRIGWISYPCTALFNPAIYGR